MRVVPCRGPRALIRAALVGSLAAFTTGIPAAAQEHRPVPGQRPLEEAIVITPHDCVTPHRLTPELERLLGSRTLDRRVGVDIVRDTDGLAIRILYDGVERGVRHIKREPRCGDYVDVVAIAVAMALEALVPPEPREPIDAGPDVTSEDAGVDLDAGAAAPVAHPPVSPDAGARAETRDRGDGRLFPSVRATVETASNVLPVQAWSLATGIDLRRDPLGVRWRVGSGITFPSNVSIGGGDVTGSALFGRAGGCLLPLPARLKPLRLCAGVLVGAVLARGKTPGLARSSVLPFVHPNLGLELSIPTSHGIGIVLGADALVGAVRPELLIASSDDRVLARRRPDLVGVLVAAGLEWND